MRKHEIWISVAYCVFVGTSVCGAQETKKAGLWEISTTTRIQQQGETPGNLNARGSGADSAPASGMAVCLTRELLDTYGVILPPSLKDCDLSNVAQAADSFKADLTCKGGYNGFGSIESTWTDEEHVTGKLRFVSKTKEATNGRALTWTQESTAVFKGEDCGAVKPRKIPVKSDSGQK